jgi:hypothetical protein
MLEIWGESEWSELPNSYSMMLFSGSFEDCAMTDDFFRNRLDQMIDLRHPLAVLANRMPWQEIEASLAQRWARQVKAGKKIEDLDLFGPGSTVRAILASAQSTFLLW